MAEGASSHVVTDASLSRRAPTAPMTLPGPIPLTVAGSIIDPDELAHRIAELAWAGLRASGARRGRRR